MSLDANNHSLNNNHSYENLLHVYQAAKTASAEQAQVQFATLSETFRQKIFDKVRESGSEQEREEHGEIEVFQNLPALQLAIQQVALQEMQRLPQAVTQQANLLCSMGRAKDLTEAYLICLQARSERDELVSILDAWVAEGTPDEDRQGARTEIMLFVDQPLRSSIYLAGHGLKSLPPIFERRPFVNRLRLLRLEDNQLRTLPREISHLQQLTFLILSGNELYKLPDEICGLRHLKMLDVEHNQLLGLPQNIGSMLELDHLVVNHNPLTDYPQSIFMLPESCKVEFLQTALSDRDIAMIQRYCSLSGYEGPKITYSQKKGSLFELNQFLKHYFPEPRLVLSSFPDLINDPRTQLPVREWPQNISPNKHETLTEWLRRVSFSSDYDKYLPETIEHVVSAMESAQTNPLYREKFWEITGDATTDCGDRGALSLLRLGLWRKVLNADPKDIKGFALIVSSMWPFTMLDRIAAHKIEHLIKEDPSFEEDTQVFLEYPLKLKDALGLDIDVKSNRFSAVSGVTPNDLNRAEAFVNRLESNHRERCRFLLNEKPWFNAFIEAYPEEVKGIEEYIGLKMDKLGENIDSTPEDYDIVSKTREEMFIQLIAFKLGIEIPERPLEEIIDWETDLHHTFGVAEGQAPAVPAHQFNDDFFDSDPLGSFHSIDDYLDERQREFEQIAEQLPEPNSLQANPFPSIADLEAFLVSPEEWDVANVAGQPSQANSAQLSSIADLEAFLVSPEEWDAMNNDADSAGNLD